jgi:hypothetical protein
MQELQISTGPKTYSQMNGVLVISDPTHPKFILIFDMDNLSYSHILKESIIRHIIIVLGA